MPVKKSDETLVSRILEGDTEAYEILVQKYQGAVFGLAYHLLGNREDAEDLAQEAFLQAYLHLNQLKERDRFAGWLKQITANLCRMWLRQNRGTFISLEDISGDRIVFPHQEARSDKLHDAVMQAIRMLPEESRLVLTLYYTDGLSYREIGDFLQLPLSTIKWRLYDARKKLKKEVIKMVKEDLKAQKPELSEKVAKKLADEIMGAFGRMSHRISEGERGILQLSPEVVHVPVSFEGDFLDDLKKVGFEKVSQRKVAHLRRGSQWENADFFKTVIQHQFKHETGKDIYLEVGIPTTQEKFLEFNPQSVKGWYSGSGVRKAYVFYPHTEENSAVTAAWAHAGQYISLYCPLGFSVTLEDHTDEKRKEMLAITQVLESFFNVVAERLGYPPAPPEPKRRMGYKVDPTDWHRWRDLYERRRELGRIPEVDPKEAYRKLKENPPEEGHSSRAHYGLRLKLAEARANALPISPPEDASAEDIGEIDLNTLGFRLVSSEKGATSMFGVLSLPLPDNSVHLGYRGPRGKKVSIDLIKFNSYEEAGEFYWKVKHQNAAYSLNSDHPYSPMKLFRSPIHPNRHVNAIWGDKKWIINIRIPITKPNAKKSKSCPLKEEELREEIAGLLLSHFAKLNS